MVKETEAVKQEVEAAEGKRIASEVSERSRERKERSYGYGSEPGEVFRPDGEKDKC